MQRPDCRFLLFDFRLVTGIDSSATHSFSQIREAATECGAKLVLVNLTAGAGARIPYRPLSSRRISPSSPNLDCALEACEQDGHRGAQRRQAAKRLSLRAWLTEALGNADHAERLAARCRRIEVEPGDIIARQGEPADSMHFILEGRVGIVVDIGERPLGPGAQPRAGTPRSAKWD